MENVLGHGFKSQFKSLGLNVLIQWKPSSQTQADVNVDARMEILNLVYVVLFVVVES